MIHLLVLILKEIRMVVSSLNPDHINIPGNSKNSYSMNKQKINIEKIENLECKESDNNFIARRNNASRSIFPGHVNFKEEYLNKNDQSEYDEDLMNERLEGTSNIKRYERDIDANYDSRNEEVKSISKCLIL
jgi:hypothetical protein